MKTFFAFFAAFLGAVVLVASPPGSYHLRKKIPLPGDGGWDYLTVDAAARRLYVSHATQVEVLDADSGAVVGKIPNTKGVHGIAIAPELGRGFTSNGQAGTVTIFALKTLESLGEVQAGKNPDGIVYDPATRRVLALNGGSASVTVIEAAEGKVVADGIDVGGRPEGVAVDGKGSVFIGLSDKDTLLRLDARELAIKDRWTFAGCTGLGNMAMDKKSRRLFIRCRDRSKTADCCVMGVINADTGRLIATAPIGDRVDSAAFDPQTRLIFFPDGNGRVTVLHEDSPDKYSLVENVPTPIGARTLALDLKTHTLFLPTAGFGPLPAPSAEQPNPRPPILPGTFTILVVGR